MKKINLPVSNTDIKDIVVGDMISLSGKIYTGRDAALPKLVHLIRTNKLGEFGIDLQGSAIFHTAVSPAGVGPTSSNKLEIEESIAELSRAGVKFHLGKGTLKTETVEVLDKYNSIYAVVAPVTALLQSKIISKKVVAFKNEGMEALHLIEFIDFPAIVSIAHGKRLN